MKADFTRSTFSPHKHFTRVLMQQGRVQVDADWNEQAAIQLRYLRALAIDVIGEHAGPSDNWGLAIAPLATPPVSNDFRIGSGHYYVDGILCEVDATPVPVVVPAPGTVVQVPSWTVDGVQFQLDQYVEVFDEAPAPAFAPTVVQIRAPDQARRTLTLQGAPNNNLAGATAPTIRRVIAYKTQPDYPVSSDAQLGTGIYQVYVDVWERPITYVEDDSIREVALGGPDTAARAKVVWQVKLTGPLDAAVCLTPRQLRNRLHPATAGCLKAMARQDAMSTDPCIVSPDARYRRPENQLYRVEIHRAGTAWDETEGGKGNAATFKWSRENGSVVLPIIGGGGTTTLTLEHLGRDDRLGLAEGDWVEVQDDDSVLRNRAGKLLRVQAIDRVGMAVTLSGAPDGSVGADPSKHPLLRRWDHEEGDPDEGGLQLAGDGAALIVERTDGNWLSLEDGVRIQFQVGTPAHVYRTGDYWLIPARAATADVEWPREPAKDSSGNPVTVPVALPPAGVHHHYAPLAVVSLTNGSITGPVADCRKKFATLVELTP